MATWSSRRKLLYGGVFLVVVLGIALGLFFSVFYKKPTCFDGFMNGNETGVDCGGSCRLVCQSAFVPAKIAWGGGKAEQVAPGFYNVASYIINPNTNAAALNVPYKFSLFDKDGLLIIERKGAVNIPAHRNTIAFESAVEVGKRVPTKVTFEFLSAPVWFKSHDTLDGIVIIDKKYQEDAKSSSLEVTLANRSLVPYYNVGVGVVLYNKEGNAIGFSRTQIDVLNPAQGSAGQEIAPYTWPVGRQGEVTTIEALPVVVPLRD